MRFISGFLLGLMVFFALAAAAQSGVGIQGGTNLSMYAISQDFNDNFDTKPTIGFSVGATALFPLSYDGKLWLNPSFRFIQKGGVYQSEESDWLLPVTISGQPLFFGSVLEIKEKLNYLELPILLQVRLSTGERGMFLQGGFYYGIGLNGKRNANLNYESLRDPQGRYIRELTLDEIQEIERNTETTFQSELEFGSGRSDDYSSDIGLYLGGGYVAQNMNTNRTFFLSLKLGLGLKSLFSIDQAANQPIILTRNETLRNLTVDLSVAYTFDKSVN